MTLNENTGFDMELEDTKAKLYVTNAFKKFIFEYSGRDFSCIDDVHLEYMLSILKDLGRQTNETESGFDVDEFIDMISEFVPDFSTINRTCVFEWLFMVARRLESGIYKSAVKKLITQMKSPSEEKINKVAVEDTNRPTVCNSETLSLEETNSSKPKKLSYSERIDFLMEMFPHIPEVQLRRCLSKVKGKLEKAVKVLLGNQAAIENSQKIEVRESNSSEESCHDDEDTIIQLEVPVEVEQLCEIFPHLSVMEIMRSYDAVGKCIERATQLLLSEEENCTHSNQIQMHKRSSKKHNLTKEERDQIKESMISKYFLVEEREKSCRPVVLVEVDSKVRPITDKIKPPLDDADKADVENDCSPPNSPTGTKKSRNKSRRKSRLK